MSLHIEPEVHNVPILHHVFLAFHTQLSGFAHGGFAAVLDIILILDDLCPDESLFKIRMDNAGAFVEPFQPLR